MTNQEYQSIYDILNNIKEDVNNLKVSYTKNNSKLDSLNEEVKKLSSDHEQLRDIISTGNYGKNSLLEEVRLSHSKIHYLEGKLESAKTDIGVLEDRWVKFLWAISIAVFLLIISAVVANTVKAPSPSSENSAYILVYNFLRL